MKVGNPEATPPLQGVGTARTSANGTSNAGAGVQAPPTEEVSSVQVELSEAATRLMSGSDAENFDAAKVERMSQAIASGTFQVNPEVIADKLIANAQEVLGRVDSK